MTSKCFYETIRRGLSVESKIHKHDSIHSVHNSIVQHQVNPESRVFYHGSRFSYDFSHLPTSKDFQKTIQLQSRKTANLTGLEEAVVQHMKRRATVPNLQQELVKKPKKISGIRIADKSLIKFLPVNLFQVDHRIPPRVDINPPVGVLINENVKDLIPVTVTVVGNGGGNGEVLVNGSTSVDLNQSSTVKIKGSVQTSPGHDNKLMIAVKKNDLILLYSGRFTIAAIPVNWNLYDKDDIVAVKFKEFGGEFYGMTVGEKWESDSGDISDLDEGEVDERVEVVKKTGIFEKIPAPGTRQPTKGNLGNEGLDDHAIEKNFITGNGESEIHQIHVYSDKRTGIQNQVIEKSGYIITQKVTQGNPIKINQGRQIETTYTVETKKEGKAVTVNGVSSKAGLGRQENKVKYKHRRNK